MRSLRLLLAAASVAALAAGCASDLRSRAGTTTTVLLTRHADRDGESDELNPRGLERAQALARIGHEMRVTAIYSPNSARNIATVTPLSEALGVSITRTPQVTLFVARSVAREILDKHAGGVVVFVGNTSGNLQAMNRLLGGTGEGPMEYGDLHVLTIPDEGPVVVVKRHYGP